MGLMEIRRHKDILAFKLSPTSDITAFHARNLEIAEIKPEVFNQLPLIDLASGAISQAELNPNLPSHIDLQAWEESNNPDAKSGKLGFGIRSITINVTQICNLKCAYCAAGGDGTYGDPITKISIEKTLPQLKYLIEKVPANRKFHISFVGGEPFLYLEALAAIVDYTTEIGAQKFVDVSYTVTTNGTLMNEKVVEFLQTRPVHLTLSLDGAAPANDRVRPTKDGRSSTALVVEGLKRLDPVRGNLKSFGISGVFSTENSDLLSAFEFFQSFHPDWMEFNFAYAENDSDFQTSYLAQMDQILSHLWDTEGESGVRKIKGINHYFKLLDHQQRVENHCGSGKSYLAIDARNNMYSCVWSPGNKAELVGQGTQLNESATLDLQKPLIELNNCQTCWARFLCGGGCMYINKIHSREENELLSRHEKNELFCKRTRHLILQAFTYYKLSRELR